MASLPVVAGIGVAAALGWTACTQTGGRFSFHILGMTIGPLALATTGIYMVRSRHNVLGASARILRVQMHTALSYISMLSMAGGMYAIYSLKNLNGKDHLTTWHSWWGIAAAGLMLAAWVVAMLNAVDVKAGGIKFLWVSRNHRWLGVAAYIASLGAATLGLHSTWAMATFGEVGVWALTANVVLMGCGVVLSGLTRKGATSASAKKAGKGS